MHPHVIAIAVCWLVFHVGEAALRQRLPMMLAEIGSVACKAWRICCSMRRMQCRVAVGDRTHVAVTRSQPAQNVPDHISLLSARCDYDHHLTLPYCFDIHAGLVFG